MNAKVQDTKRKCVHSSVGYVFTVWTSETQFRCGYHVMCWPNKTAKKNHVCNKQAQTHTCTHSFCSIGKGRGIKLQYHQGSECIIHLTISIRAAQSELDAILGGLAGPFLFVESDLTAVQGVCSVVQGALVLLAVDDEFSTLDTIGDAPDDHTKVRTLFFVFVRAGRREDKRKSACHHISRPQSFPAETKHGEYLSSESNLLFESQNNVLHVAILVCYVKLLDAGSSLHMFRVKRN
jgi:hypothetical protein